MVFDISVKSRELSTICVVEAETEEEGVTILRRDLMKKGVAHAELSIVGRYG
jgi:hypothetical protein